MKRSYIREILDAIDKETISFAGGLPNEKLFPMKKIQKVASKVLKDANSLQYSQSQGLKSLRKKIANIYTDTFGFETDEDEILITTGSQQAFDIILKVFGKDEVLVQNPSYVGALSAFSNMGLDVKGFDNIEQLEERLHCSNDLYLMSDFSNPTSKSYSLKERETIANILNKTGNLLIEDGAYSLLAFDGSIQKPISSMVENSFHLGSFSKIIAPGLRVGWIRANKQLIDKLLASKESIDLHTPTLNQMIIDTFMEKYSLEEHLKKVRRDYFERMQYMNYCFRRYLPSFQFSIPKGGMFIYGCFDDLDSMEFAKKAMEKKVAFVPSQALYHKEQTSSYARFNFTNCSFDDIEKGVMVLSKMLDEKQPLSGSMWFTIFQDMSKKSKYRTMYL